MSRVPKSLNKSIGAYRTDSSTLILILDTVDSKLKLGISFSVSTHKSESNKSQSEIKWSVLDVDGLGPCPCHYYNLAIAYAQEYTQDRHLSRKL